MRELAQRPDLDQLRRQARELQRASKSLPLSAVADLDDEALGWLRRAYDENA